MVDTLRVTRSTGTKQPCNSAENAGLLRLLDVRGLRERKVSPALTVAEGALQCEDGAGAAARQSRARLGLARFAAGVVLPLRHRLQTTHGITAACEPLTGSPQASQVIIR